MKLKYLLGAIVVAAFCQTASAVTIPEASKDTCQNPDVMTKLATEMQGVTDTDTMQKYSTFIQKCHDIIAGK